MSPHGSLDRDPSKAALNSHQLKVNTEGFLQYDSIAPRNSLLIINLQCVNNLKNT